MNLVNKQYNVALGFHFVYKSLYSALKLPPELCSGNKRGQIQKVYFLIGKVKRNVSFGNLLSNTFGNSRFSDARFTYKAWIIFLTAGKNLNNSCNFLISSDNIVKLPVLSLFA